MLHGAAKLSEEVNDFFWGWWGLADKGATNLGVKSKKFISHIGSHFFLCIF